MTSVLLLIDTVNDRQKLKTFNRPISIVKKPCTSTSCTIKYVIIHGRPVLHSKDTNLHLITFSAFEKKFTFHFINFAWGGYIHRHNNIALIIFIFVSWQQITFAFKVDGVDFSC